MVLKLHSEHTTTCSHQTMTFPTTTTLKPITIVILQRMTLMNRMTPGMIHTSANIGRIICNLGSNRAA